MDRIVRVGVDDFRNKLWKSIELSRPGLFTSDHPTMLVQS